MSNTACVVLFGNQFLLKDPVSHSDDKRTYISGRKGAGLLSQSLKPIRTFTVKFLINL